jgi:uncharacterized protein (DUF362 family)
MRRPSEPTRPTSAEPPAAPDGASRRALFGAAGAAAALVASGCRTGEHARKAEPPPSAPAAGSEEADRGPFGIPGPFPGKVVEVHHGGSVRGGRIDQPVAGQMLGRALTALTGAPDAAAAWRRFFAPGDRVGLKVNCVGHPVDDPKKHAVYTSHEILREIVAALRAIGVTDLLLFDRYRMEFSVAKYPELAAELGVPWAVAAVSWDETQIDMDGYSRGDPNAAERNAQARVDGSPPVSGYDPDVFLTLDYVHPLHNPNDPRARRSHVSKIVTRRVDKIVNLCLVKDHAAAGITGALKNLSHGLVDNVCRSHSRSTLNQTGTFIPAVVSMPIIRRKVVLNVMEGFRGLYHGGPWASPYLFEPRSLLVSTDPVAMDRIALELLDARRKEAGLPPLARAGQMAAQGEGEHHVHRGTSHVELAGAAGLGVYPRTQDEWQRWVGRAGEKTGRKPELVAHERIELG